MQSFSKFFPIIILVILLQSCASNKDILYLQDVEKLQNQDSNSYYEAIFKKDDLLSIIISAKDPELTYMFNIPLIQQNYKVEESQTNIKTYLIDSNGEIDFPVIGKIKLAGLKRSEAINLIADKVTPYINNPTVNIKILNYKFSVLGEVKNPGSYTITSERTTLLEAIAYAGDLTIHGKRNNILLIRDKDGKKEFNRIDLTKSDFINSDNYYISQNDVIVVEPNKTKVNSSGFGPNVTALISATSVILSLVILLTR
jgi:polysaccharide export outer membrane protein